MIIAEAASLVEPSKTYRTLDGHVKGGQPALLALPNVHTALLWEETDDAVAFAAVIRYAPGKAYACVSEVSPGLVAKQVRTVGQPERQGNEQIMQIKKQKDGLREPMLEPLWRTHLIRKSRTAHENLLDLAVVDAIGASGLELTKNVTMDIIESDEMSGDTLRAHLNVWRDRVGFIVGDQHDLYEVIIQAEQLDDFVKALLARMPDGRLPPYPIKEDFETEDLTVYDKRVTALSREEYLSFLRSLKNARAYMAYSADGGCIPCGTAFVFDATLLHLYAESDGAAVTLLHSLLATWPAGRPFVCSVQRDSLINQVVDGMSKGARRRRIHRLHTTSPPANIKWENVYAFNAGVHIV